MKSGRRRRDRGVAMVLVSVLVAGGVLMGFAALSIDVGSLMYERRQLQNGADAVVLSAAKDCLSVAACSPTTAAYTALADSNAADHLSDVVNFCASEALRTAGSTLPLCSPVSGAAPLADCPAVSPSLATAKYLETRTATRTTTGTILPPILAQTIAGNSSYAGARVGACARAAFGPPGNGTAVLPVTFSLCEWYKATTNGTSYPTTEIALAFNAANDATCSTWAGHDFPCGFGWLTHDSTCRVETDSENWADAKTGVGAGNDCGAAFTAMLGKTVYLPIFDCMDDAKVFCPGTTPRGTDSYYHVYGYAPFHLTAVDVTGTVRANLPGYPTTAATTQCAAKGGKCIYGWFLGDLTTDQGDIDPTGPNLGLQIVKVAG